MIQQPMNRRERKAIRVRTSIFDAALRAFDQRPIASVSVLDITESADVAKGVFYLHFRSKDAFVIELWKRTQQQHHNELTAAIGKTRHTRKRVLSKLVDASFSFLERAPAETRFLLRVRGLLPGDLQAGELTVTTMRDAHLDALHRIIFKEQPMDDAARAQVSMVDATVWGAIEMAVHHGLHAVDVTAVRRAILAIGHPHRARRDCA